MTLEQLRQGKSAVILSVGGEEALRLRLLDMGLTPGVRVLMRGEAPLGDPVQFHLRGYELCMRREDAEAIRIGEVE